MTVSKHVKTALMKGFIIYPKTVCHINCKYQDIVFYGTRSFILKKVKKLPDCRCSKIFCKTQSLNFVVKQISSLLKWPFLVKFQENVRSESEIKREFFFLICYMQSPHSPALYYCHTQSHHVSSVYIYSFITYLKSKV